ncbi:MAG TPA: nickel-responsive transcriptional regulator NikR [Candidatus Syntrophoarchaeum butanivorans]|uniref:Putative nickel-responsive regulator n=1 Tax=Candidatus Syntropharchaeum butanivorans TaxID=1839936 RepID=A0A7C1AV70_9EURY|nr:MAG: nickel-responsive transcriptional regulator NikR [Candidatus Syntrophoarchaeum sp. WYZ-LMO15]HDM36168.1 nickel-responsive transcriptional regulator NikR [Candidatus Syntrophoarchaeum butanivorans]HEC57807.1 nickel-responsive transcriptional regulator NikR [Candidatus Syntrophoarchaeum butanivorans]
MPIISLSISEKLLQRFDDAIMDRGYSSRSEAFREAIRDYLVEYDWSDELGEEIISVITVIYDKKLPGNVLTEINHKFEDIVKMLTHLHLDEENCLEIFVTKGKGKRIKELIQAIEPIKGVKRVGFLNELCEI